ncbi:MAG TPA: PASTA domain-containing protein [Longimicrobiales bacterium]|nr:PASTA domain-containing protein [Longimicrobiales bacterium]
MLGDSLRRRGTQAEARERPRQTRDAPWFPWWKWLLTAMAVVLGAFLVGYLVSVLIIFPAPETARGGVPVPDLRGMTRIEAREALRDVDLELGSVLAMPSMQVEEGRVLAQAPIAEQQLRPGAAVDLTLSGGPPQLRVPPVEGLGSGTARDLLERSGFDVEMQPVQAELPEGSVVRLTPAAGSELRLPAVVTVYVSLGPAPLGDSLPAARSVGRGNGEAGRPSEGT